MLGHKVEQNWRAVCNNELHYVLLHLSHIIFGNTKLRRLL